MFPSPAKLSVREVCELVVAWRLGQYEKNFRQHTVNGSALLRLGVMDMKLRLGIASLSSRRTLARHIARLHQYPGEIDISSPPLWATTKVQDLTFRKACVFGGSPAVVTDRSACHAFTFDPEARRAFLNACKSDEQRVASIGGTKWACLISYKEGTGWTLPEIVGWPAIYGRLIEATEWASRGGNPPESDGKRVGCCNLVIGRVLAAWRILRSHPLETEQGDATLPIWMESRGQSSHVQRNPWFTILGFR